jgi:hypothetical protein
MDQADGEVVSDTVEAQLVSMDLPKDETAKPIMFRLE